jgi:hypothetical protein
MLGSSCNPCCDQCGGNKPYGAPADTGAWVPSGSWGNVGSVTWTLNEDIASDTWFFYGSADTSKLGGGAVLDEQRAWDNPCNWYSVKITSPSNTVNVRMSLTTRASTLPPENATIHVYSYLQLTADRTVKRAYFWNATLARGFSLTTTQSAHDTAHGSVFSNSTTFDVSVYGGALFRSGALNGANVYDGATFIGAANAGGGQIGLFGLKYDQFTVNFQAVGEPVTDAGQSPLLGTVYGGAVFNSSSRNGSNSQMLRSAADTGVVGTGIVFGGAVFNGASINSSIVNGGAVFSSSSFNNGNVHALEAGPAVVATGYSSTVNGGAIFNNSFNRGIVNGGAVFNGSSQNDFGVVYEGATFNDSSRNRYRELAVIGSTGLIPAVSKVAGGATFNDAACSEWPFVGGYFVVDITGLPTCNGTAPTYLPFQLGKNCGCG